ncbi:MAG: 3'(2'),5'-bisphosphate nucleotidase CysQ [Actinobacteria bacterium]|nr:3'(2'),5'-bisphosphate nucleotidase CysQ [Actinomycetota bacterium]
MTDDPSDQPPRHRPANAGLAQTDHADHVLAASLAEEAGEMLVDLRVRRVAEGLVEGAATDLLKAEGDRLSHELLMERLAPRLALGEAVLSEEGKDDHARLSAPRVWIVDPLDGTREFGEPPRSDWAVHVALTIDGVPAAGAVALPALGLVLSTAAPPPPPPPMPFRPRIIVSRTRPPPVSTYLAEQLNGELVELGSAGAKAMAVVRGETDIYVHAGGQYEWDSCAPVAVALSAGVHCSRIDGSPLLYNRVDSYLPDLLICRIELAEVALGALMSFPG